MNLSTFRDYLIDNYGFLIAIASGIVFLIVNIIQAVRTHNLSLLKEALRSLPQVISNAENYWKNVPQFGYKLPDESVIKNTSLLKKSYVDSYLKDRYGKLYIKNKKVFDDAIEDILSTPQKKGGPVDVSQTNEEK